MLLLRELCDRQALSSPDVPAIAERVDAFASLIELFGALLKQKPTSMDFLDSKKEAQTPSTPVFGHVSADEHNRWVMDIRLPDSWLADLCMSFVDQFAAYHRVRHRHLSADDALLVESNPFVRFFLFLLLPRVLCNPS